jgi:hypothetical protein
MEDRKNFPLSTLGNLHILRGIQLELNQEILESMQWRHLFKLLFRGKFYPEVFMLLTPEVGSTPQVSFINLWGCVDFQHIEEQDAGDGVFKEDELCTELLLWYGSPDIYFDTPIFHIPQTTWLFTESHARQLLPFTFPITTNVCPSERIRYFKQLSSLSGGQSNSWHATRT